VLRGELCQPRATRRREGTRLNEQRMRASLVERGECARQVRVLRHHLHGQIQAELLRGQARRLDEQRGGELVIEREQCDAFRPWYELLHQLQAFCRQLAR